MSFALNQVLMRLFSSFAIQTIGIKFDGNSRIYHAVCIVRLRNIDIWCCVFGILFILFMDNKRQNILVVFPICAILCVNNCAFILRCFERSFCYSLSSHFGCSLSKYF